jgi:endonuclease III related protein
VPRLDESVNALDVALADRYGSTLLSTGTTVSEPFAAVLAAAIRAVGDSRKTLRILEALRDAGLLEPSALAETSLSELATVFPSALGALPPKLLNLFVKLATWVQSRGGLDSWTDAATSTLRDELIGLPGVGLATADVVLLHGLDRPVYPVDRASYRILARHGWIDPSAEYDEPRELMMGVVGDEPTRLGRFSEWFASVGRDYCRASAAKCECCPLRPYLPEHGPLGDEP